MTVIVLMITSIMIAHLHFIVNISAKTENSLSPQIKPSLARFSNKNPKTGSCKRTKGTKNKKFFLNQSITKIRVNLFRILIVLN